MSAGALNETLPELRTERLVLTIPGAKAADAVVRFNCENERHLARSIGKWTTRAPERDTRFAFFPRKRASTARSWAM